MCLRLRSAYITYRGLYGCERQMGNGKGLHGFRMLQKVAHKWDVAKKIVAGETKKKIHLFILYVRFLAIPDRKTNNR